MKQLVFPIDVEALLIRMLRDDYSINASTVYARDVKLEDKAEGFVVVRSIQTDISNIVAQTTRVLIHSYSQGGTVDAARLAAKVSAIISTPIDKMRIVVENGPTHIGQPLEKITAECYEIRVRVHTKCDVLAVESVENELAEESE